MMHAKVIKTVVREKHVAILLARVQAGDRRVIGLLEEHDLFVKVTEKLDMDDEDVEKVLRVFEIAGHLSHYLAEFVAH